MANSRSRKSAPTTRPASTSAQSGKASARRSAPGTVASAVEPSEAVEDDTPETGGDGGEKAVKATAGKATATKTTTKAAASANPTAKRSAVTAATDKKPVATKSTVKKVSAAKSTGSTGSAGRRFGDGAGAAKGSRSTKGSSSTKSGGRGGKGRSAPPTIRVGPSKPWGMIIATAAVLVFAAGVIGYAVYQANSSALPESPEDIDGVMIAEYVSESHVVEDQNYAESPPIGGLHDSEWADCDGAIYDVQIRPENAVHSLEHGAVWVTYNPDEISEDDLAALSEYVAGQDFMMMSPYSGLSSLVSLQSWNHQLQVDAVDDPRINEFIQVLRHNQEFTPEFGASCTNPTFLTEPLLEGDPSRAAAGGPGAAVTDDPTPLP